MELRQLRYFLAVAEELHFGRAAQALHMSQPPLSQHIGRLERELGVILFDRSTRHVTLTSAGALFRDRVRELLAGLDDAAREAANLAAGLAGELSVGFVSSANYSVLPFGVPAFRHRHQAVNLRLVPATSGEQVQQLMTGELDVGLVRDEPVGPGLTATPVFEEELVVCLPTSHPLACRHSLTCAEAASIPQITYPRHLMPGFVDQVRRSLGGSASQVVSVQEVIHQETALGFVAAGAGATLLPSSIREHVPPSVVALPLVGAPTTRLLAVHALTPEQPGLVEKFVRTLVTAMSLDSRHAA